MVVDNAEGQTVERLQVPHHQQQQQLNPAQKRAGLSVSSKRGSQSTTVAPGRGHVGRP